MQIDELRGELTSLADEMAPFAGDVRGLHRRQRRRRVVTSTAVVLLAGIVAVSTVVVAQHRKADRVQVTGRGSKEVAAAQMTHVDVIVVPANDAVENILDSSPLVALYARIPAGDRAGTLVNLPSPVICSLQSEEGFAVDASGRGSLLAAALRPALGGSAAVYDVSDRLGRDAEIFFKVGASPQQIASVRALLAEDPEVRSFEYIDQREAYSIFKKDFADQPALVQSTKPSDLPESFRVVVSPGVSAVALVDRYRNRPGVDVAITSGVVLLFSPASVPTSTGTRISRCPKP